MYAFGCVAVHADASGCYQRALEDWKVVEAQFRAIEGKQAYQEAGIDAMLVRMKWASDASNTAQAYSRYLNAIRASLKRPTLLLRRNTDEMRINNYNPVMLSIWQANMDLQVSPPTSFVCPIVTVGCACV
jgi:hypothetical protein